MKLDKLKQWEDPVLVSLHERASAFGQIYNCTGGTGASENCGPGSNASKECSHGAGAGAWCRTGGGGVEDPA